MATLAENVESLNSSNSTVFSGERANVIHVAKSPLQSPTTEQPSHERVPLQNLTNSNENLTPQSARPKSPVKESPPKDPVEPPSVHPEPKEVPTPPSDIPTFQERVAAEWENLGDKEDPVSEEIPEKQEEDDGTPAEKPPVEVQRSDAAKGKSAQGKSIDKSIEWGVQPGAGSANRLLGKKIQLFNAIETFHEENKKWPNQVEMVALAKKIGISATYSTVVDQIRIASAAANDRKKNDLEKRLQDITDKEGEEYVAKLTK
ncbi:hypothetical protein CYMTET_37301 [Cymbomonas tetramitiformis]|uniref:Uncharacterized protein n=1 Tax=Cymbomonas tetramitiformis TaxID=36881 RepID=A0AAE0CFT2_9CHLO|nr:hypothetical protein CYMTET_37301 [Cymbomonas tetramitiformis]